MATISSCVCSINVLDSERIGICCKMILKRMLNVLFVGGMLSAGVSHVHAETPELELAVPAGEQRTQEIVISGDDESLADNVIILKVKDVREGYLSVGGVAESGKPHIGEISAQGATFQYTEQTGKTDDERHNVHCEVEIAGNISECLVKMSFEGRRPDSPVVVLLAQREKAEVAEMFSSLISEVKVEEKSEPEQAVTYIEPEQPKKETLMNLPPVALMGVVLILLVAVLVQMRSVFMKPSRFVCLLEGPGLKAKISGKRLASSKGVVIGRSHSCDLRIKDKSISKRHLLLYEKEYVIYCRDLGSTNGTTVNGIKLPAGASVPVSHGSTLCLGSVSFRFMKLK